MRNTISLRCHISGFGLVELMISVAIGLVLIAGVSQIYVQSKNTYRVSEAASRLQENGRFAIIKLREDIRMAGYFGCGAGGTGDSKALEITNNLRLDADGNQQTMFGDFDVGITGVDNDGGTSDSVTIMRTVNSGLRVVQQMPQVSAVIFVTENNILQVDDILLICDVAQGDIFQMTGPAANNSNGKKDTVVHNSGAGDPGNYSPGACDVAGGGSKHCLSTSYGYNAKILKIEMVKYYVANGAAGTPALFRSIDGAPGVELVEGVENMQIVYGIDSTGNRAVDRYADASSIATAQWERVMSARVSLLFRSTENNITQTAHKYTFDVNGDGVIANDEEDLTVADNRLRQVITGTINIRNRTF